MIEVVKSVAEIDVGWLNQALAKRLKSSISSVSIESIGTGVGLMGELARMRLEYAGEEDLPATMIAKCAAQNENIEVARILDFYNREVNFYNHIGTDCLLDVPKSYYGAVNQDTYDCVLLMEDLGDVSPRDQVIGASVEEAESALKRLARMHAKYWGRANQEWLYPYTSDTGADPLQNLLYLPAVEPMIEKFPSFFTDQTRRLVREVGERYPEFWSQNFTGADTFIHGDYRQDNMIYAEGSVDAKVMDWQISGRGKSAFDVAYFMCQSLPSELRLLHEKDLLEMYVDTLVQCGVEDYTFDQCWQDYRRFILGCLVYPVTVCGTLDLGNERGLALAECMLQRNLAAIEQLNCFEFVS